MGLVFVTPGAVLSQQPEMEALAGSIVQHLRKEDAQTEDKIRIALFGLARRDGARTRLGVDIAETIGDFIRQQAGFEIVQRSQVDAVREKENWSKADLTQPDVAFAMAEMAGANHALIGFYARKRDVAEVVLLVYSLPKAKQTASFKAKLPLSEDWKKQEGIELPVPSDERPASSRELDERAAASGVAFPGKNGVTNPECKSCPDPNFTSEARAANFQGRAVVLLWTIVGEDGMVKDVRVVKSQPFGLTRQAMEAVRRWRLKPATKDGKPVAVVTYVEVTFRLI